MTNKIDKIQMPDGQVLELACGGSTWGLITGDITAQTDLQTALDGKQNKGNYALKSEIPTKTSQLTNDSGFINNDSTFVHKSGNETIAGVKTFSSTPVITSGNINLKTTTDGSIQYNGTNFLRKSSNGGIVLSGTNTIYIRPNGDNNTTGQLSVEKDGTVTGTKFVGSLKGNVTGNVSGSSGSCTGNSATATKATQDGNGNNIVNTYATKTSLNGKADVDTPSIQAPYLKDTYKNGTSGYRIWSDGYCEQWGSVATNVVVNRVTLLKKYKDTNYNVVSAGGSTTTNKGSNTAINNKTQNSFSCEYWTYNWMAPSSDLYCMWKASGYLAEGEY